MGRNSQTKMSEGVENICRLCLRKGGSILIWDKGLKYWYQIKVFCRVRINQRDGLPKHICEECSATLAAMEYLREKAQESDKYLRSKLDVSSKTNFLDIKKEIDDEDLEVKREPDIETELECVDPISNIECHYENISQEEDVTVPYSPISSSNFSETENVENDIKYKQEPKMNKKGKCLCPICGKVLHNASLHRHLENHKLQGENVVKEFFCSECTCSFLSQDRLEKHMKLHSLKKKYPCTVCGKEFKSERTIDKHMRMVHERREARKCPVCQKILRNKLSFAIHFKMHSEEEKCDLNTCDKGVEGEHIKHKQIRKKGEGDKQLCPICGKVVCRSGFDAHLQNHKFKNDNIDKEFKCSKCYFAFYSKERLEKHMKYHSLEKIYPCNVCGKKFKEKNIVTRHMRLSHEKYQQTECTICHKILKSKNTFKTHMGTHTRETQYECDICKKRLNTKLGLICHVRTHTGERPYKCHVCKSSFTVQKSLVEHVRLHTGEKPYKCPICNKGFAQKSNMKSHFRYNHKGEVYK